MPRDKRNREALWRLVDRHKRKREALWRLVDRHLANHELNALAAVEVLESLFLTSESHYYRIVGARGAMCGNLWILLPDSAAHVAGPRLILNAGDGYGGARIFQPVQELGAR